jgi:hypothetical protein
MQAFRATWKIIWAMGYPQRLLPLTALTLALASTYGTPWLILAVGYGVLAQGFVEYGLHRFVYHRPPPTDQSRFDTLYRSHIGHHENPGDPAFFTGDDPWFPLRFAAGSFALHLLVLWPILGLPEAALTTAVALFIGSVPTFLFYEYCHTLAHLDVPKGRFGRHVTRSHLRHHFNDHAAVFHVTAGFGWIDRLLGTAYDRARARARFDPDRMLSIGMDPDDLRLVIARRRFGVMAPARRPRGPARKPNAQAAE